MKEIKKREYLSKYKRKQREIKNLSMAAQIALDTRKFEIELYWKRAAYFWAFIAADIAAFALIYARMEENGDYKKFILMIIFSMLGVFFSVGWYFANRGSKYWQENWEDHIGVLVTKEAGPIFKYHKAPNDPFFKLNGNYPFSVSRINQFLSLLTAIFWLGLFEFSLCCAMAKTGISVYGVVLSAIVSFVVVIMLIWYMYYFVRNDKAKLIGVCDKDTIFIRQ